MKPFPEAVQKAFPCTPGWVPERPWWKPEGFSAYRRSDDQKVYVIDRIEEVAEYDAKHPLPHPGYRAGQIWAAEDGASICIVEVAASIWAGSAGRYWTKRDFAFVYPYLTADPACPHLAPWSPVEGK
jgi:hypothetical protein